MKRGLQELKVCAEESPHANRDAAAVKKVRETMMLDARGREGREGRDVEDALRKRVQRGVGVDLVGMIHKKCVQRERERETEEVCLMISIIN